MNPAASAAAPDAAAVLAKAVLRAAETVGFRHRELAAVLGVSPSTVSRLDRRGIDPASKEGELALLFLRVARSLDALVGGDEQAARKWMRAANHHLGAVPAEAIATVAGLVHVAEYLDAMRGHL
ncbi:MAG: DUF2384 domain-containing protein [Deltaproteobacteria bacterium]|nr:MAG: DUF2384 domain-containing protein [Deltaproteobacteria bacterium]